jgi:hypothetical protein
MKDERTKVPAWLVERLAHDDLPPAEAARVRAALGEAGKAQLEALGRSNQEILAELPPRVVAAEVKRRLETASTTRAHSTRSFSVALSGLALGAAGLVAVYAGGLRPHTVTGTVPGAAPTTMELEETGVKGPPQLIVYRKDGDGEDKLSAGTAVRPRDLVQVAYVASGWTYGLIVSFDARGTVTYHLPEAAGAAAPLKRGGRIALPHAFELDDSPGFERFVLIASKHAFTLADVQAALQPGGTPLPEPEFASVELTLKKELP